MTSFSMPGTTSLVSERLAAYLQQPDDAPMPDPGAGDELDQLITTKSLKISRLVFVRELDLWLVVLDNRQVLSQSLLAYPFLQAASDEALNHCDLSETGIHWPTLDADLSLRGFLLADLIRPVSV